MTIGDDTEAGHQNLRKDNQKIDVFDFYISYFCFVDMNVYISTDARKFKSCFSFTVRRIQYFTLIIISQKDHETKIISLMNESYNHFDCMV